MISSWTDIFICCIILCMLNESDKVVLQKFQIAVIESSDDSNNSSSESQISDPDFDDEEIAADEFENDIIARKISTERKFDNDMQRRSFLEKDMAYTVAGRFSSKLLVEVEEILFDD